MAMLITKFNKLIASKLLWIGFTFVIVMAFVVWDTNMPDESSRMDRGAAGTLHGKPVSHEEFRNAYVNAYLGVALSLGGLPRNSPDLEQRINETAWRRLITLRTAQDMGLEATDSEVIRSIESHEGFAHEGRFEPRIYEMFIRNFLGGLGFSERQFERYIREEIVLQKLQRVLFETILVSPMEMQRALETVTDSFQAEYVVFRPEDLPADIAVSEEQARRYFEENLGAFTLPAKVRVQYARFPVEQYLEEVTVTDDDAMTYYEQNINDYMVEEEPAEPGEDEASGDDLFRVSAPEPFEEVRDEIMERLLHRAALRRATDVATTFVIELAPDRFGQAPPLEEAAAKFDLTLYDLEPFAQFEQPEGIDAGPDFNRAAFELRPNPMDYFSDAIPGAEYVYVMALKERIPPRAPEFDEVAERVYEAARRQARERALRDLAEQFRADATDALKAGKTFEETARLSGFTPLATKEFTAISGLEDDDEYAATLIMGVLTHNQGELTEVLEADEQHLVVAHVARRTSPPITDAAMMRNQVMDMLARERARVMFDQWQEYLLREADFQLPTYRDDLEADDEIEDWTGEGEMDFAE